MFESPLKSSDADERPNVSSGQRKESDDLGAEIAKWSRIVSDWRLIGSDWRLDAGAAVRRTRSVDRAYVTWCRAI
jgi:hypothetical protein